MGLFSRSNSDEWDYVTLYRDEDSIHPKVAEAFDWYSAFLDRYILTGYHDHIVMAGGALRSFFTGTNVRDYDLYLTKTAIDTMGSNPLNVVQRSHEWSTLAETPLSFVVKSVSYDLSQQHITMTEANIIKKPHESLQSVIDGFDFTVCMCAISNKAIVYHPDYFTDLTTKTLRVHNPEDPASTLWRIQKYNQMGYTISKPEMWKVVEGIHMVDELPKIVKTKDEKNKYALGANVVTLDEVFRSS